MKVLYRCIRHLLVIFGLIFISFMLYAEFTTFLSSLGRRRYHQMGTFSFLRIKRPRKIYVHVVNQCSQEKLEFWNKIADPGILSNFNSQCLQTDGTKTGITSLMTSKNFEGVNCSNKAVDFARTSMTQVLMCFQDLSDARFFANYS